MTQLCQRLYVFVLALSNPSDYKRDSGQATSEYALVMLAAALIALLVIAWATGGGGAGKIGQLFDRVIDSVTSKLP
ncbi:MAG: DUF4244 domain-containing protein [Actinomycetes bacterium]